MKNNQANDPPISKIWQFVRGDMLTSNFEQWVYSDPAAEKFLGKDLFLEVVSINFSSNDAIFTIKETLKKFAISVSNLSCMCPQLSNLAVIDMGDESRKVLLTFDEIKRRGEPYWWLAVYQCRECQQSWLLGEESRQNDVYCLHRLDNMMMENLLNNNRWPSVFDHYEDLLRIGFEAGKKVRFFEPLTSRSLRWTISDLAKDNPGISISKIAKLLNLDLDLAEEIARTVVQEDGVSISFEGVK
jgi:hypothetical protein